MRNERVMQLGVWGMLESPSGESRNRAPGKFWIFNFLVAWKLQFSHLQTVLKGW